MQRLNSLRNRLPPLLLGCSLFAIYFNTLAPGLTWANGGSDGGDLITAAATGGIAHPTGYPLYLVLARLFQYLPLGSLAFRTNLMSALFTALGAILIFEIVTRSVESQKNSVRWLAGLVAAYAFGLAPLIWSQAVITEVYALQAFLIVLIIYLYTIPPAVAIKSSRLDCWRGLVLGLATSNHVTSVLLVPMALALSNVRRQPDRDENPQPASLGFRHIPFNPSALGRQLLWLGIGLSPYLLLPLRALTNPPVNWGNPVTFERFWWLVTGQLYQSYYLQFSLPEIWQNVQAGAALLLQQFGIAGVLIGIFGLIVYGSRSRILMLTVWIASVYAALAFLYRSTDSYVYLIPAFLCIAIWLGVGIAGLMDQFMSQIPVLQIGFGLLVIGYFLVRALTFVGDVDASHDLQAESFGREILSKAPKDSILFAQGDKALFTLWYFHFALGERPDVAVVAVDLLHFDWYQENLRSIYASLQIPGPFPWPETIVKVNPARAICYVQYSSTTGMDCSPPLLTP
jgi:MFS family permease